MPLGNGQTKISKPAAARHFEAFRGSGVLALLSAVADEVRTLADQKFELLKADPLLHSPQENWAILVSTDWPSLSSAGQGARRWPCLVLDRPVQRVRQI